MFIRPWMGLMLVPMLAVAGKDYGAAQVTAVTSIYDADTFRVNIDGWPAVAGERIPVRVKGVDAPELRGQCDMEKQLARQAKQFTVRQLRQAKQIELKHIERGKYFRLLAEVWIDGKSLSEELIKAGHAKTYAGGGRQSWCL
ncbi:thermonuclease family protein [Ferrimonas aestuarii]|uniref:Thermonuclease family protein n=1 Tax=Ferrimonas aestuarii TaxID=2569539 RepID=A0A4U1BKX9_9GAMM|nr:thermonuclease family protein [Ferrimonas aestuarii]TKB53321.1 thermonuclease family protein [Ferrimonas aestuarii]